MCEWYCERSKAYKGSRTQSNTGGQTWRVGALNPQVQTLSASGRGAAATSTCDTRQDKTQVPQLAPEATAEAATQTDS